MNKREAAITQEYLKSILEYDPFNGIFVWINKTSKYSPAKVGSVAGVLDKNNGYRSIRINGKDYREHRLAWLYVHGEFPCGEQRFIDHVDQNRANNRINNLRVCTQSENLRNTEKYSNNTTGLKGVFQDKRDGRFRPRISNPTTGKLESLGGFTTKEEASLAYEAKSKEYSGDFYRDTTQPCSTPP